MVVCAAQSWLLDGLKTVVYLGPQMCARGEKVANLKSCGASKKTSASAKSANSGRVFSFQSVSKSKP